MTGDDQREYKKQRDVYRRSILAHERATAAFNAALDVMNATFKAMQDASAAFHGFCDAQARKEDA